MLAELLGATAADHAWALRHALRFLDSTDAARLVVALLESADDASGASACVHWLRFGDAPLPPVEAHALLGEAASHACWRALAALLDDLRAKSPPWVALYDDTIAESTDDLERDTSIQRAIVAHRGTHYRFGHSVVRAAVARGDLKAVQWLLPRSAVASGQTEPTRRQNGEQTPDLAVRESLAGAAEARHLDLVQWIITRSPFTQCVLPYDEELEAVCWIEWTSPTSSWCNYACVTNKHGYIKSNPRYSDENGTPIREMTPMPLADAFARDGDLVTLKKIRARDNYKQLIGSNAIALAAEHGHLDVVQWLFELFPATPLDLPYAGATRGCHVHILEWLRSIGYVFVRQAAYAAAARGHVQTLRWHWSIDSTHPPHVKHELLGQAIRKGHLNVVAFFHEECKVRLEERFVLDALAKSTSIPMLDYVLCHAKPPIRLPDHFLNRVALYSSVEVVKHLVLDRGIWSRDAFSVAIKRHQPGVALEMGQFLYSQAQERVRHLQTPLENQCCFEYVRIAHVSSIDVAKWLLQSVPGIDTWDQWESPMRDQFVAEQKWRRIISACIRHRPDDCLSISWFPQWAVRVNSFDTFGLLEQCGHPQLRHIDTFHAIIEHSRDARFMLKLLPSPDDDPNLRRDVVEWAAKYGMLAVLDRVFDHEDPRLQCQLVKRVAHHVGVSGHVEMGDWLLKRLSTLQLSITAILKGVDSKAVCHGHTQVLGWLRGHQLMPTRPQAIEALMLAAGTARQVRSLQWLVSNSLIEIPPKAVVRVLLDGVRQNHTEVVNFITRTFSRDQLPVRDKDIERVREYLHNNTRQEGVGDAVDIPHSQEEDGTCGRQSKRSRRT